MGSEPQAYRKPALTPSDLIAMVGKDDLLAYDAVHLGAKSLIGVNKVDTAFVAQSGRGYRFFVECGNDCTMNILRNAWLRVSHPKFQVLQGLYHTVGAHLIRITYPGSKMRISLNHS